MPGNRASRRASTRSKTSDIEPSLLIPEVAVAFRTSEVTIRRMIADGRLPARKVAGQWQIRPEVVAEMLGIPA